MKSSNKTIWIGGIIGGIYALVSFLLFLYNIDGTFLEFLMPIISPMWFLSYLIGPIFAIIAFILIGIFIGFIFKQYKEIGIAILIATVLSFISLYLLNIFLKDTSPGAWIIPLIFIISIIIGIVIKNKK